MDVEDAFVSCGDVWRRFIWSLLRLGKKKKNRLSGILEMSDADGNRGLMGGFPGDFQHQQKHVKKMDGPKDSGMLYMFAALFLVHLDSQGCPQQPDARSAKRNEKEAAAMAIPQKTLRTACHGPTIPATAGGSPKQNGERTKGQSENLSAVMLCMLFVPRGAQYLLRFFPS